MTAPTTVSLFCGGGGESVGKHLAFEELGNRNHKPGWETMNIKRALDRLVSATVGSILGDQWAVSPTGEIQRFTREQYLALQTTDARLGWRWAHSERRTRQIAIGR